MNRILLACIALALPSFVAAAAPCNILPYANQCQGSNLWPVPAGWAADNNGDCQPEAPYYVPAYWGYGISSATPCAIAKGSTISDVKSKCCDSLHTPANYCELVEAWTPTSRSYDGACLGVSSGLLRVGNLSASAPQESCRLSNGTWVQFTVFSSATYTIAPIKLCPEGATPRAGNPPIGEECIAQGIQAKPSNEMCTARWTSSAKTTLQKDPLDPDCTSDSCVFDGTCRLR